ncbi:hypothetical protein [Desulfobacter sp. UBA2225]|uniref:hypothetical protein n=1 Tax=Desulfobacter sp. UBA2225 TaxID=1961413 RepID=UPI003BB8E838
MNPREISHALQSGNIHNAFFLNFVFPGLCLDGCNRHGIHNILYGTSLLKSLMGRFIPWSMGPMATAFSEARWTALYVLLPVFKSGKINTVARPATWESGSLAMAVAWITFSRSAPVPEDQVE